MFSFTHYIKNYRWPKYSLTQLSFWLDEIPLDWMEWNVHLNKLHVLHGLDMKICLDTPKQLLRSPKNVSIKKCSPSATLFLSVSPLQRPSPLIILTQKDIPSSIAMAFLFCKTQQTGTFTTRKSAFTTRKLAKISTNFFHYSVSAVCSGSDPPTSLINAWVLLLFLLLSLSGHKVVEMSDSTFLPILASDVSRWF